MQDPSQRNESQERSNVGDDARKGLGLQTWAERNERSQVSGLQLVQALDVPRSKEREKYREFLYPQVQGRGPEKKTIAAVLLEVA